MVKMKQREGRYLSEVIPDNQTMKKQVNEYDRADKEQVSAPGKQRECIFIKETNSK